MKTLILLACIAVSAAWDYADPSTWGTVNAVCGNGKRQSPINIIKKDVAIDKTLYKLQGVNYNNAIDGTYTVENKGFSLKLTPKINSSESFIPFMVFNHIAYELAQFHIHWGRNSNEGSEHTIDGKKYPAEIHFVHFNRKYKDLSAAADKADGLLVVGLIFELSTQNNTKLDAIIGAIPDVMYPGNKTSIPYTPPQNLFPTKWEKYFHYKGSLTTPGCFESVLWFVNQEVISISEYQLEQMRGMYGDTSGSSKITHNFRPPQPLNSRIVSSIEVDKSYIYLKPSKWDYKSQAIGAAAWKNLFPICQDNLPTSRQSPINIVSADAKYNNELKSLKLTEYSKAPNPARSMIMANNGHSISVSMETGVFPSTITHKGVEYRLAQYHFHWGNAADKAVGSEHTFDGKAFFAEVHFVHYNSKYTTLGEAAPKSDGLLVWGHFIQAINGTDHTAYKKILDNFSKVAHNGKNTIMSYIPPLDLIPIHSNHYYTYPGSLTTPNCFESVTWIVNRDLVTISLKQAKQFLDVFKNKETEANAPMLDNYRPVQALNGRKVEKNFESAAASITASTLVSLLSAIFYYVM